MTIYERIKNRRLELNMSQDELALSLGYKSRSSINKIEMGKSDIPQSKIAAFAKALNTTPGFLMGWNESNETASNPINGTHSIVELKNPISDRIKRLQAYHESFLKLNSENQEKANEYIEQLLIVQESKQQKEIYLNAAHEIPGATEEQKAHDEALMQDDSIWE
jgi:transcriptional regulator with XRE-family HTH domain